ncbi:MAG: peptidylprolyl isomerase [Nonlabens sp.]
MACKDTDQISQKVKSSPAKELLSEEQRLAKFYKRKLTAKGDTLLPNIPQDSVAAFFKRYGKKNEERFVRINTKYGTITLELFEGLPLYRSQFIFLVKNKYFDDTEFYRVVPDFIVQAGNSDTPLAAMRRTSSGNYKLPPMFKEDLRHERGTLSLAKEWENNPENWHNPFDFFITLQRSAHLDDEHTIFGKVISGIEVADQISKLDRDGSDWPRESIFITMEALKSPSNDRRSH